MGRDFDPEMLARLPVFKTGAFNHSATHPALIFNMFPSSAGKHKSGIATRLQPSRQYHRSRGVPNIPAIAFAAAASPPSNT